jgi:Spy/CpxP family protein refolding chaperone
MSVGHVVVIAALTFFALGALRRAFWFARWRRRGGSHGWRRHGGGGRSGPRWIEQAIGATPEQAEEIAEIVEQLRGDAQVLRRARSGVVASLVELLPGEHLDEAALGQVASQANAAYEKVREDLVRAIAELHRTLTPAQRRQVTRWLDRWAY